MEAEASATQRGFAAGCSGRTALGLGDRGLLLRSAANTKHAWICSQGNPQRSVRISSSVMPEANPCSRRVEGGRNLVNICKAPHEKAGLRTNHVFYRSRERCCMLLSPGSCEDSFRAIVLFRGRRTPPSPPSADRPAVSRITPAPAGTAA